MTIDSKHPFINSAGCHYAKCIPCKTTETWKLQSVSSPPVENVSTPAMPNPKAACGSASFSQLRMYNTTTA